MRAYKFLDAARRAPFTSTAWAEGVWVEAGKAQPCREGVHACRPGDLAWWLASSLWEIELDGEVVASRHKVAARRGRLVRELVEYPAAARELAELSAWRTRDRAVELAASAGDGAGAGRLAAVASLAELVEAGKGDEATVAGRAAALAGDSAHFALQGDPAQGPFVAACAAGHAAAGDGGDQAVYDAAYGAERSFQSAWLAARLALDGPAA